MTDQTLTDNTKEVAEKSDFDQGADESEGRKLFNLWSAEVSKARKHFQPWEERGVKIIGRYRAEDVSAQPTQVSPTIASFNILWSNIETLKPALYARTPQPAVTQRWKNRDPVAREAAQVVERTLAYGLDTQPFDSQMRLMRDDYLLVGRGTGWVRYEPRMADVTEEVEKEEQPLGEIEPPEDEADDTPGRGDDDDPAEVDPAQEVVFEEVCYEYVYWRDFIHDAAPTWGTVGWVARRALMTRDQLRKRFGGKNARPDVDVDKIPLSTTQDLQNKTQWNTVRSDDGNYADVFKRAEVYEVWSKEDNQVIWFCPMYPKTALDWGDPPLRLKGFWPCPRPTYSCLAPGSLVPVPDYAQYQDQAHELDVITAKISLLVDALRVAGVYNGKFTEIQRLIQNTNNNVLIPVQGWAELAQNGGLPGVISFLPLKDIAETLNHLYMDRDQVKQVIYEITGIADIIRGSSKSSETATAQRIKGQFAGLRLEDRQQEMQRFARDWLRLGAEIVAEHFAPETLELMTGSDLPSMEEKQQAQMLLAQEQKKAQVAQQLQAQAQPGMPPPQLPPQLQPMPPEQVAQIQEMMRKPTMDEVVELLRNDALRGFRIDVETDSTIMPDEQAEKEARIEFLTAMTPFMQQALAFTQATGPAGGKLMAELMMFAVRAFKAGKSVEGAFEAFIDEAEQQSKAQQPKPDPEVEKTKMEMQIKAQAAQQDAQLEQQKAQQSAQLEQQRVMGGMALQKQKLGGEMMLDRQRMVQDVEMERERMQADMVLDQEKAAMAAAAAMQKAIQPRPAAP
ncbi:MAG: hypothetical protein AB7I33_12040 [Gemmatimonadales bacterium]